MPRTAGGRACGIAVLATVAHARATGQVLSMTLAAQSDNLVIVDLSPQRLAGACIVSIARAHDATPRGAASDEPQSHRRSLATRSLTPRRAVARLSLLGAHQTNSERK